MDVMALTELEARQIYTAFYWNVMSCDQLPRGLDIEVFDFGVTAGTGRSAFTLQTLLGFTGADLDHVLGNETATAASKAPLDKLLDGFNAARLKYYSGCKGYNVFGAGWDARTRRVFLQARAMAGLKYS
jgi:lysozyme family protein